MMEMMEPEPLANRFDPLRRRPAYSPFSRSLRSLQADRSFAWLLKLFIGAVVLVAWATWFFFASVSVYAVADNARIEVDQAGRPIEAPVGGRIVAIFMTVGQAINAGDVIVELEPDAEQFRLQEEQARRSSLFSQIGNFQNEIDAEEQRLEDSRLATRAALDEARAKHHEAETAARFAHEQAERSNRLHSTGLVAESEFQRSLAEAEQRRSAAEALRLVIPRMEMDQRARESGYQSNIERLRREQASVKGTTATETAIVGRLEHEVRRRRIVAPASGRLGDVAQLRVGEVVREGDKLAVVLPAGKLRAIAEFSPSDAIGRIQIGQPARLRLDSFPWAQYGFITGRVASVASEKRDERIRVEFDLDSSQDSSIPLQHGLPGKIEVEVERISPAALVLRAAGKRLGATKPALIGGRAGA